MAYSADWELLSDALKRVLAAGIAKDDIRKAIDRGKIRPSDAFKRMMAAGIAKDDICKAIDRGKIKLPSVVAAAIAEDEAKRDICNAIADRKIKIRIWEFSGPDWEVHYGDDIFVPPHLEPNDFLWPLSRWMSSGRRPHPYALGIREPDRLPLWYAKRIELSREDVTNVLCAGGRANNIAQEKATATGAKSQGIAKRLISSGRGDPERSYCEGSDNAIRAQFRKTKLQSHKTFHEPCNEH